jgi:hypothetical protein
MKKNSTRNLKRVYQVESALDAHNAGKKLFYSNNTTQRAELRQLRGNWCFQYIYDTYAGVMNGSIKFARPTVKESLTAFFKGVGNRFLYVEDAPSVDDEDFGITITVPKGTKVTIIEV